MSELDNNISYSIFEYLEGNLSTDDRFTIQLLIETDKHWKKEFELMQKAYLKPTDDLETFVLDTAFKKSLLKKQKVALWIPYSIAASLLFFISIGVYISKNQPISKIDISLNNPKTNPLKIDNTKALTNNLIVPKLAKNPIYTEAIVTKAFNNNESLEPNSKLIVLTPKKDVKPEIVDDFNFKKEVLVKNELSMPLKSETFIIETQSAKITQPIVFLKEPKINEVENENEIKLSKKSTFKNSNLYKIYISKVASLFNKNLKKVQTPDLIFVVDKSNFSLGLSVRGHN